MAQKAKIGLPVPRRRKPAYSQGTGQRPATPPRQQTIKVNTNQGPVILEALTWGPLAVHKSQGRSGWTVTHIPSGFALKPELTQEAAVQLVTAIRERGLEYELEAFGRLSPGCEASVNGSSWLYQPPAAISLN